MSNQTSNQTAPGDTSGGAVIYTDNGKSYLNREAFDFKKHTKINNGLFWRAFKLGIFLILSIFITGFSSYYIEEYRKKENYESWIYYILYFFLIISLVSILLIILLFAIIPYAKIRGILLLVKSMTNIYGADYADPEIHNSMGSILGKTEAEGNEIATYLQQYHGNVPSQIIRSFNPSLYDGASYPSAPIQQVTNADGEKTEVAAVETPVPAPRTRITNTVETPVPAPRTRITNQVSTTRELDPEDLMSTSEYKNYLQSTRDQVEEAANLNQPKGKIKKE